MSDGDDIYMTEAETEEYLRLSRGSLKRLRYRGKLNLPYGIIGEKGIRYSKKEINEALSQQRMRRESLANQTQSLVPVDVKPPEVTQEPVRLRKRGRPRKTPSLRDASGFRREKDPDKPLLS